MAQQTIFHYKPELRQLLGKLSYVSACVRPGRAFMSRLLNALRSCASSPKRTVHPVSDALRADIIWWLYFLSHYNGVPVIPSDVIILKPELFATNACLTKCGESPYSPTWLGTMHGTDLHTFGDLTRIRHNHHICQNCKNRQIVDDILLFCQFCYCVHFWT